MTSNDETIVALATPAGVGAISVIRISGSQSIAAVDKIFRGKKKLAEVDSHTIHYGIISWNEEVIDDVLVSVFKKPNSYTGEDSVEISTHGSPLITQKILELLIKSKDVTLAEPGEFTKRAFLNNRIDLSQAEAVLDVINSRTEASLRGSRNQLDGLLSAKVNELREMLVNTSSFIELELDFAEEDIEFIDNSEVIKRIDKIVNEIDLLLSSYSFGKVLREGINVAIVGQPNVGKSSLLNYILKESRAIVSDIPGTTRDVIREDVTIDGILFRLYDTAGIRISDDEIEKEGVARSRNAVKNSDLILFVTDVNTRFPEDLFSELNELNEKEHILKVLNKIDVKRISGSNADVEISAKTGEGINNLFELMKKRVFGNSDYSEKSAIVSNIRHYNCLNKAKESLINARNSSKEKMSGEFISVDLRNAENSLAEIIGVVTSDDILNNIFSKFCIGK